MKPLGICRTAFYVSKMVMCAVLVIFSLSGRAQSSVMMEKETCAFLQSLPAGLQKTQADAVRRAINGDCTALISVRNSRNTKPEKWGSDKGYRRVLSFVSPCRIRYYSVACVDLLTWGWLVFRECQ